MCLNSFPRGNKTVCDRSVFLSVRVNLRLLRLLIAMKLKLGMRLVGFCGILSALALAQNTRGADEPSLSPPANSASDATTSPALTRAEALKIIGESRRYVAHPSANQPPGTRTEPQVQTVRF